MTKKMLFPPFTLFEIGHKTSSLPNVLQSVVVSPNLAIILTRISFLMNNKITLDYFYVFSYNSLEESQFTKRIKSFMLLIRRIQYSLTGVARVTKVMVPSQETR